MGEKVITQGVTTDTRVLAEAKLDAEGRVFDQLISAVRAAESDPYILIALLFLIVGALKDNSGTAFASWPAGTRTAWNQLAAPKITATTGLYQRLVAARAAINAATTIAEADAVAL